MFSPIRPSRRVLTPSDYALDLDAQHGVRCPRCRKPKMDLSCGLVRGCCCGGDCDISGTCDECSFCGGCNNGEKPCCPDENCCTPKTIGITFSGITLGGCSNNLDDQCRIRIDELFPGAFLGTKFCMRQVSPCLWRYQSAENRLRFRFYQATPCSGALLTDIETPLKIEAKINRLTFQNIGSAFCGINNCKNLALSVIATSTQTSSAYLYRNYCKASGASTQLCNINGCSRNAFTALNRLDNFCTIHPDELNCGQFGHAHGSGIGGQAVIEVCPGSTDCTTSCDGLCTYCACCECTTIRAVTSGATVNFASCLRSATHDWKLTGATAVNATRDLVQDATNKCLWQKDVASDHVLKRARKVALHLRYRMTKTTATEWRGEVLADNGADSIRFFDGTLAVTSGDCSVLGTITNANVVGCGTGGSKLNTGSGGTMDYTPVVVPTGTTCASCTATPSTINITVATVTSTLGDCACSNQYRAEGTTAVNRTITLTQVGGSPCVYEATVAADYLLFDHVAPDLTITLATLRHILERTAAGTWSERIIGMNGAVEQISYAGLAGTCPVSNSTFAATANDCRSIGTNTWPSRTFCLSDSGIGIMGSGGSTTHAACPT